MPRIKSRERAGPDMLRSTVEVLFLVLRVPLFLTLYWLRTPVVLLCNWIAGPTLFAFLVTLVAFREKTHMLAAFGTVSLMAFVIAWAYDYLLMLLSPQDTIKIL